VANVLLSRGCPYSCAFCFNSFGAGDVKGRNVVSYRSPESISREFRYLRSLGFIRALYIHDDTFGMEEGIAADTIELVKSQLHIPFYCQLVASRKHDRLLRALRANGCVLVSFGVETGSEMLRTRVLRKPVTDDDLYTMADRLHSLDLGFRTYNMLGIPGERLADMLHTCQFNAALNPRFALASVFCGYKGMPLIKSSTTEEAWESQPDNPYLLTNLCGTFGLQVNNLQRLFWLYVRFPSSRAIIERSLTSKNEWLLEGIYRASYFFGDLAAKNLQISVGSMWRIPSMIFNRP
jgi:anaerobic magnesium-protoporphyrin IX monomethyl ester cyclase